MGFFRIRVTEEEKTDKGKGEETNKLTFKESLIALMGEKASKERKEKEEARIRKEERKKQLKAIKEGLKHIKVFVKDNLIPLLTDINTVVFSGKAEIKGPKEEIFPDLEGGRNGSVSIKLFKGKINLEVVVYYNDYHIQIRSDDRTRLSFCRESLKDSEIVRKIEENFLEYLKNEFYL